MRGNSVAGAPIIKSTDQFPKPPIRFGINKKKVITKVLAVTLNLQIRSCAKKDSGCPSSVRIMFLGIFQLFLIRHRIQITMFQGLCT